VEFRSGVRCDRGARRSRSAHDPGPHRLSLPYRYIEVLLEAGANLVARETMVLAAAMRDLQRAQQRCEAPGGLPVPAVGEPIQQTSAIGVAAPRRIDHLLRSCARDLDFPAPCI